MTLVLTLAAACAFVAPPVAAPSSATARCMIHACTTPEPPPTVASPAGALGAAEIAVLGVGVAGLAAFGIEHPIHDRTPFVAAAALLGLLLTAGEGLLPDGRVATTGGKGGKKRTGSARMAAPPASTDMACYIVDGVQTETGDLVVCTPQPQEFAWFHGIELGQLREIEDTESYLSDESVACEREVSYNGEEEWYCR